MDKTVKHHLYFCAFLFLYTILFIFNNGYYFGSYTHSFIIPFIDKLSNIDLFPDDIMFSMLDHTYSYFFVFFSFLSKFVSLKVLFFVFYLLSLFFSFFAIFKITEKLYNKKAAFIMLILMYSGLRFYIGGSPVLTNLFVQYNMSLPLLLWALFLILSSKIVPAIILTALAFNFHAMSSLYFIFLISLCFLFNIKKYSVKKLIFSYLLLIVLISPAILWILKDTTITVDTRDWINILRINQSHHIFPFSFPIGTWLKFLIVVFIALFLNRYDLKRTGDRVIVSFYVGVIILFLIGTVFTEFIPVINIIKLQLFRSCKIPIILGFIVLSGIASTDISNNEKMIYPYSLAFIFLLMNFFTHFFLMLLFIFLEKKIKKDLSFVYIGIFAVFTALGIRIANPLDVGIRFGFLIFAGFIIYKFTHFKYKRIASFALPLLFVLFTFFTRSVNTLSEDKFSLQKDIQLWTKENTDISDKFFVDPGLFSFRVFSQRSTYGQWGDGAWSYFSHDYANIWYERMNKIGIYHPEDTKDFSKGINSRILFSVLTEYPFKYLVLKKPIELPFVRVYENSEYVIFLYE